jgi:hypothetical protein
MLKACYEVDVDGTPEVPGTPAVLDPDGNITTPAIPPTPAVPPTYRASYCTPYVFPKPPPSITIALGAT